MSGSLFLLITESQNVQGLKGTSVGHLVQPSCRSRVTYSRLHRTLSRRVLNISRGGDSTTSLGSLFQCSVTLRGKKFFLTFRWNLLCFSLCPLPPKSCSCDNSDLQVTTRFASLRCFSKNKDSEYSIKCLDW